MEDFHHHAQKENCDHDAKKEKAANEADPASEAVSWGSHRATFFEY